MISYHCWPLKSTIIKHIKMLSIILPNSRCLCTNCVLGFDASRISIHEPITSLLTIIIKTERSHYDVRPIAYDVEWFIYIDVIIICLQIQNFPEIGLRFPCHLSFHFYIRWNILRCVNEIIVTVRRRKVICCPNYSWFK